MKKITLEMLKARTPEERWNMYAHSMAQPDNPDAVEIMRLIDEHNLSLTRDGGLPAEHPLIREIYDVAMSGAGVQAAVAAITRDEPGMAGVDPLLQELVPGYGERGTTTWAGFYVAEAMRAQGYKTTKQGPLPPNCKARTAMKFTRG